MEITIAQTQAKGPLVTKQSQLDQGLSDLAQMQDLFRKRQVIKCQVESSSAGVGWARSQATVPAETSAGMAVNKNVLVKMHSSWELSRARITDILVGPASVGARRIVKFIVDMAAPQPDKALQNMLSFFLRSHPKTRLRSVTYQETIRPLVALQINFGC